MRRSLSRHGADLVIQRGHDQVIRLSIVVAALIVADWVVKAVYVTAARGSTTSDAAHPLDTVLKVVAMLALAGWFIATARPDTITRRLLIFLGLLVSAVGDLITQVDDLRFYVALLLFLVVHLLFLASVPWRKLAVKVSMTWKVCGWMLLGLGVVALGVSFAGRPFGCQPWANGALVGAYTVTSVATVLAFVLIAKRMPDVRPIRYLAASAGVGAFLVSDIVLFVDAVNDKTADCPVSKDGSPAAALIAIVLYQAGQYAFATAVANA